MAMITVDGREKTRIDEEHVLIHHKGKGGIWAQVARERETIKKFVPTEIEKMIFYPFKQIEKVLFLAKMNHGLL